MSQASDLPSQGLTGWLRADREITRTDLRNGLTWLFVVIGLLLRILEFADNRATYLDERLLLENLTDLPVWDLHTVLSHDQLAPPGFLILERLMVRLPLPVVPTARVIPFLAAIATMWFFPKVARKYLDPRAVPLATAFFAFGDYSIYYASEIKQYSLEVALTLMALGLAARVEDQESERPKKVFLKLALFGAVGVWFSLPLIFSLAAVGLVGWISRLGRKDWKQLGLWTAMGLAWLLSFGGCFLICDRIVSKAPFLRTWWDFAFLRIPPNSMDEATGVFWQFVNVVIDPTGVISPVSHVWTALLCNLLMLIGLAALLRRSPAKTALVVLPFLFAVASAALKAYPFHGRLIQFLIPAVVFLLAEGIAVISRGGGFGLAVGLLLSGFLLIQPAYDSLYYRFMQARSRPFDSHGDLHNDLLDELEARSRPPLPIRSLPRQ